MLKTKPDYSKPRTEILMDYANEHHVMLTKQQASKLLKRERGMVGARKFIDGAIEAYVNLYE